MGALRSLLDSIIDQTCSPDEVVICDGGSTDQTSSSWTSIVEWLPLRCGGPGSNISQGRNRAIATATGDIIAATDAGSCPLAPLAGGTDRLSPMKRCRWSALLVPGRPYTDFEVVMGPPPCCLPSTVDPVLPSSRSVAFRKSAGKRLAAIPNKLEHSGRSGL